MNNIILNGSFYTQPDVVSIAKALLGKVLVTCFDNVVTSGMITETEAYAGVTDKASHAYGGRRTNRTETMYCHGGIAYIYLCYGIHHMFNVVTNIAGTPHAVLIRAIQPLEGIDNMLLRRGKPNTGSIEPSLTTGPGALGAALGMHTKCTGTPLSGPEIWIEDRGIALQDENIIATNRIGVGYAQEDAQLPYRFYIKGNRFVSKQKR